VLVGCGNDPRPASEEPAAQSGPAETSATPLPPAPIRPLPARGEATVRYTDGVVSVDAFAAPRLPLLERLSEEAGFVLIAEASDWPPLTLRIDDMAIELALPLLVGDLEYAAEWRTEKGTHRLTTLTVGAAQRPPSDSATEEGLPEGEVSAALERALDAAGEAPPSDTEAAAQAARFADADPEQRIRAALAMEAEGDGLKTLCDMLANDPDPRVRAATTASLENSEDFAAVRALVDALHDPNPEVVVEVIDSLEFAADASIVPDLEKLLAHTDLRVRQRAADAIDFFGR